MKVLDRLTKQLPFRTLMAMTKPSVKNRRKPLIVRIIAAFTIFFALVIGVAAGLSLAGTINIRNQENFTEFSTALPTRLLDSNGRLITEFSAEEKRELVTVNELPKHLIYAVLAREDKDFYEHRGFTVKGIARAFYGQLIGKNLGGGSTITQQVAGTLYLDRSERTIVRKIKELWWALQIERRFSKNEILELYLNEMYMGAGTYGVEAASKYFFGHSAREITLAEAAILVIQYSSPARYNPLDNPNVARDRQTAVLDRMVELGYTSREEADKSFNAYWDNYDYTRVSTSAYFNRDDKAPWFSEYVRRELEGMLYGSLDLYKDGFIVHTTLDLDFQESANRHVARGIETANNEFRLSQGARLEKAEQVYKPVIDLLSLFLDIEEIYASTDAQLEQKAINRYVKKLNPVIDAAALMFGIQDLKIATNASYGMLRTITEKNTVEAALISLENETGYIKAMIGGSKYEASNQLIRATQGNFQPGSSFKPLYYSAAIDTKKYTAASAVYDSPVVFYNEDGIPYIPTNYKGEWKGPTLLWHALATSMNVPSLKILDGIGFDAAIDRAAALLGITDPETKRATFPRVYPLGLGVIDVKPIQMARAFAIFGNQGKEVTPIAIRAVEDRNGRVILDPEKELRLEQQRKGSDMQIISQQNAYVMSSLLQKTVESGTLAYAAGWGSKFTFRDEDGNRYSIPAAGKTGTTQNWADAWAVGFTPYFTTAVWYGFDLRGNSLGVSQTGATLAGPTWADFMRDIHQGLPYKDFYRPNTGIIDVTVCSKSGLLPTEHCDDGTVTLPFLEGTQPTSYCDLHEGEYEKAGRTLDIMRMDTLFIDDSEFQDELRLPVLDMDSLPATRTPSGLNRVDDNDDVEADTQNQENTETRTTPTFPSLPDYNPLLD